MISAFKRLVSNDTKNDQKATENSPNGNVAGSNQLPSQSTGPGNSFLNNGMQMISQSLQKKFSKGVNYNMKIVIRGDNNVGKTNLWLRLQGQNFEDNYTTSEEIKVANIQWNYKTNDDVVKVEVWDVVDRSKKKRSLAANSLTGEGKAKKANTGFTDPYMLSQNTVEASLDAEFIDVYKNANGCIMIYDITKAWTWDYIERELPKVPSHIPVLIIGNFIDKNHYRAVDQLNCRYFIQNLNRGGLSSTVRYTEASMRSGFGLKYLYKFFNIPFLQLQRENLMQQLEINAKEMDMQVEELELHEANVENDYEQFTDTLNNKRRVESELNAQSVLKNAKSIDEARKIALEKEQREKAKALANATEPQKMINNIRDKIHTKIPQLEKIESSLAPKNVSMSVTIEPEKMPKQSTGGAAFNDLKLPPHNEDEFDMFLNNMPESKSLQNLGKQIAHEDSEDDEKESYGNPMVAGFKETIDSDEDDISQLNVHRLTSNVSAGLTDKKKSNTNTNFLDISDESDDDSLNKATRSLVLQNSVSNDLQFNSPQALIPVITNKSIDLADSGLENSAQSTQKTMHQIDLTSQDFDFLENMTSTTSAPTASVPDEEANEIISKKKKKSSRVKNDQDELSDTGTRRKSSKKSKSKSTDSDKEKKAKKKDKKDKKENKSKTTADYSDIEEGSTHVKPDLDYEEI